jgi:RimJ/RimL family protein N-acetyltransferase
VLSDIELLDLKIEALYRLNADGRILGSNEPEAQPAPRLFVGHTRLGNRWRFGRHVSDELVAELERVLQPAPITADLTEAAIPLQPLRELLQTGEELPTFSSGPTWRFPDEIRQTAEVTLITADNVGLLLPFFPWAAEELSFRLPCAAVVEDGVAVSICCSSRNTAKAAEAGVDTIEQYRGRGHATAVTAAWARAVRASGRIPFYSTWWENAASRGVARKLGLIQFSVDLSIA